ncbi:CAMK family protein kinase [Tritrichomonas foetus]|uniref:CAMK family protein kinase n=2 Tax=Tritrichomonas TaxID=5723 RepID=A0A1J4JNG5_9EUKA|nr:putative serine/threonine protein kinase [Tritrichomonas foetus]OHT00619.1 CAMK family protein kinase [Tritrichomonas foetus]|eukprot:OHT00619.1 CAMK family protein kinase [Tritrichomonas foetus]
MSNQAPNGGDNPVDEGLITNGSVVDDFEIMEQIGSGAFSHVHIAKHTPTGCFCAAKIVDLRNTKTEEFVGIMREVSIFMQVDHPNICNLYRLSTANNQLIFFMEYASRGTLLEYVNAKGTLTEFEAQRLFIQIFNGLRHLHIYHFLVHRDLKLENILIDSNGNMKLTDFGLAGTYYNNLMRTFVGTAGYQPPEIIAGSEYDEKCDVWSLGVCLYAMLTGCLPFSSQNNNVRRLLQEVSEMKYPPHFSPGLVDLLKKMFEVRPASRPTLIQLQNHPWLRGLQQLGTNIAPQPVIFYKVTNVSMISKFKRRSFKPDPKILEKTEELCREKGIDTENLVSNLQKGLTGSDTTCYFCLLRFLGEKPAPPPPPKPKVPIIPGTRKKINTNNNENNLPSGKLSRQDIMKIDKAGPRKGSVPTFSQTAKLVTPQQNHNIGIGSRPSSNKSNPLISSTKNILRKPLGSSQAKRKPL